LNDRDTRDPVVFWENEIIRTIHTFWEMEHQGLTLKVIDKLVADSDALVDATPETANVNWSAVNAVDALRWLWWRNTGKYAPARALNPASKFHAYLSDGFEFLEVQADPISAFKAWVKRGQKWYSSRRTFSAILIVGIIRLLGSGRTG
jgi:hypothetical protein